MRRTADPELAADLAAETFAAALLSVRRFDPRRGGALAWTFGIAHKKLLRALERGRVERGEAGDERSEAVGAAPPGHGAARRRYGRRAWRPLVPAVALAAAVLVISRPSTPDERAASPDRGWTTTVDPVHGVEISLPPEWRLARASLTPRLVDPREVLAAARSRSTGASRAAASSRPGPSRS